MALSLNLMICRQEYVFLVAVFPLKALKRSIQGLTSILGSPTMAKLPYNSPSTLV